MFNRTWTKRSRFTHLITFTVVIRSQRSRMMSCAICQQCPIVDGLRRPVSCFRRVGGEQNIMLSASVFSYSCRLIPLRDTFNSSFFIDLIPLIYRFMSPTVVNIISTLLELKKICVATAVITFHFSRSFKVIGNSVGEAMTMSLPFLKYYHFVYEYRSLCDQ